jgi:hypothetical protein
VYRASADIRETVLQGAVWFDPGDNRWPAEQAVQAALESDVLQHQARNSDWLKNSAWLQYTHANNVFSRIADVVRSSLS